MQEAPGSNDLTAEDEGGGSKERDEDYIPGKKSVRTKRRTHLSRKPSSSKTAGDSGLLEAGVLGSRRGATGPVECPTCHKSFLSKYYLKVHNRQVCMPCAGEGVMLIKIRAACFAPKTSL